MNKLVVLSLLGGDLNHGFPVVTAQVWDVNQSLSIKFTGSLPPAPELSDIYRKWRLLYQALYQRLSWQPRMKIYEQDVTNVSVTEFGKVCQKLESYINKWLNSQPFQNIERQLRTRLSPDDEIRVIIETNVTLLHRLPWHLWYFFEDYRNAEVALSSQNYEHPLILPRSPTGKVKILAIFGNSNGIDVNKDQSLLKGLESAQTKFLVEPTRRELNEQLWNQDWDILFFAGHSSSQPDGSTGQIYLNQTESLTIPQLKNALQASISRNLKLAIFNSCDGIGLARNLADLHIPQIIVMREGVPDLVAQEFLKHFLFAFAGGKSFYLAVREARERLQGLENNFPCASWLPVVCQNQTVVPVTWQELRGSFNNSRRQYSLWNVLLSTAIVAASVLGLRYLGVFQTTELQIFDQMLRLRSPEEQDANLVVVEVTENDIQTRSQEPRRGSKSISDISLAKLLNKLQQYQPRIIGVDIYRDSTDPVEQSNSFDLTTELSQDNVVAVCKGKDSKHDPHGIKPPSGVPQARQGFTDAIADPDGIIRRQILMMAQEPSSFCATPYSLSLQLAARFLFDYKGIEHKFSEDSDYIQFGSTVFKRLKPGRSGGYQQQVDLGGIQILANYRAADFQKVSLEDVLSDAITPDLIKDKVVLIGVTANSNSDAWTTPYSTMQQPYQEVAGVFIQAQMVSQILNAVLEQRTILWVFPFWGDILWICGWSLTGSLIYWRIHLLLAQASALIGTVIILYAVCTVLLLIIGVWVPFIPSAFAIVTSSVIMIVLKQSHSYSNS